MKLRRFETINNEVVENLVIDFTNDSGKAVNTVIIAGENGVGKSYLINLLFEFSKFGLDGRKRNEQRKIEIELTEEDFNFIEE